MVSKILKIKDIKFNQSLYPRGSTDWQVILSYKESMDMGAKFPPIIVGVLNKEYVLIDGKHRIEANKRRKEEFISAIIDNTIKSEKDIYVKAIKSNISHGHKLGVFDRVNIIIRLKDFGYSIPEISTFLNMPVKTIKSFQARMITNSITGVPTALRPSLSHLAGETISNKLASVQEHYFSTNQYSLIRELNSMIENKLLDFKNKKLMEELMKLRGLLNKLTIVKSKNKA